MARITLLDFLAECLEKNGNEVDTWHSSDNSNSGIAIRKQVKGATVDVCLNFNGNGTELQDIEAFEVKFIESDQSKIF